MSVNAAKAKKASRELACLSAELKNKALENIAAALLDSKDEIIKANQEDLAKGEETGLATPLLKRLKFDETKLSDVTEGIKSLISLEDPLNKLSLHTTLDDGLELYRVTCPIGVIGVIFESRPDALVQIASLCLKSGNAVFLKGGSEAFNTNAVLAKVIYDAGIKSGLPEGWLYLITTRSDVNEMLGLSEFIDLIIPRGSNAFVQYIMQNTTIAVMGHADGVCHTYVSEDADIDMAMNILVDCKTQYVSVCNATETILIDRKIKDKILPMLVAKFKELNVEMFGDDEISSEYGLEKVTEWHHEYLDYKVSLKIVEDIDAAIDHINTYSSGHTDAIITTDKAKADKFTLSVDSGCCFVNCSTRFSDGFRFGFGAEVGVSTSKLHARGPVGLEGLVSYKYKLIGNGQIVADYASHKSTFKHIHHKI
ncbi:MAG: glutamate-5-semialdehyde dehydrogenase [Clostridiales bacterium]|nr:glutamate-5-semialdehyde dehydrogenase [Clostridiales bacterium]